MRLEIPDIKYIAQDANGRVFGYTAEPTHQDYGAFHATGHVTVLAHGRCNPDWGSTLVCLESDSYDYDDGILKRL